MVKVSFAVASRKRRKRVLKAAKGQRGGKSKLLQTAKESVKRAMAFSYRDRKRKKREFRTLWISRINAACRELGISYSKFINGMNKAGIKLNRKVLADIALNDKKAFKKLAGEIKN